MLVPVTTPKRYVICPSVLNFWILRVKSNGARVVGTHRYLYTLGMAHVSLTTLLFQRREQYQSTMVDLVMKLGVPGLNKSDVTRDVRDVFDFEVELAKVRGLIVPNFRALTAV
eukprot:sb/3476994/